MAYELIETVEVGSGGAASIEFTSIPQDGTDLVLKVSIRAQDSSIQSGKITINNDSSASYDVVSLIGLGSSVSTEFLSGRGEMLVRYWNGVGSTSNTFSSNQFYFSNYTSSTNKSISGDSVTETNATGARMSIQAFSYSTSSPITSLKIEEFDSKTILEHSTASLYKVIATS